MAATTKEDVYQKIREGKYNNLTSDETALIPNANIPENVREKMGERTKAFMKTMEEKKGNKVVEKEEEKEEEIVDVTEETPSNTPITNSNVPEITITNPPTFLKIGNHLFTTQQEGVITLQSQTNFDSPGGVGNVYTDLKKIYGVHPVETPHNYNLLLHNFGVYHKDDSPLFDKGGCTPGSKDALKNILQLGLAYLQAKQNSTKRNKKSLANINKVDNQIPELKSRIAKLETMDDSKPVCDITRTQDGTAVAVAAPSKPTVSGPMPNCLQDVTMLQNFLNILTLMMGVMSDDAKRENLKKVDLKNIISIGMKNPKNIGDAERTVISNKIQELLDILHKSSSAAPVTGTSTEIQDFLQSLKEDEGLQEIANETQIQFPERLDDVLGFFENILGESNTISRRLIESEIESSAIKDLKNYINQKEQELQTLTINQQVKDGKIIQLENDMNTLIQYINNLLRPLQIDGQNKNTDEIIDAALHKIDTFLSDNQLLLTENSQLQTIIDDMKQQLESTRQKLETSNMIQDDLDTRLQGKQNALAQKEAELAAAQTALTEAQAEVTRLTGEKAATSQGHTNALAQKDEALTAAQAEVTRITGELTTARQELEILRQEKATVDASLANVTTERNTLSTQLTSLERNLAQLRTELDEKDATIRTITGERNDARTQLQSALTAAQEKTQEAQQALANVQEVTQERNDARAELERAQAAATRALEANNVLQEQLAALAGTQESRVQELIQSHANETNRLQSQIQELERAHQKQIADMESDHRQREDDLAEEIRKLTALISTLNAEKDALQSQLENKIGQIGTMTTDGEQLRGQIAEKDTRIRTLTEQLSQIETLQTELAAANTEKEELQGRLTALQSTSQGNEETIAQLRAQIETQRQKIEECKAQAAQITEKEGIITQHQQTIASLTRELETLRTQAAAQISKEEIQRRLDIVLPYLLVDGTLQTQIKLYITGNGLTDDQIKVALQDNKNSMCMIFQMAYSLILYNNTFLDSIEYFYTDTHGITPTTISRRFDELNSSRLLTFIKKGTRNTERISYNGNENEKKLLFEIIILLNDIFSNSEIDKGKYPILYDILSNKDVNVLSEENDSIIRNTLKRIFPNKFNTLYIGRDEKLYYGFKDNKKQRNHWTATGIERDSSLYMPILLILFTQLINKHITPKLIGFVERCKPSSGKKPTFAEVARASPAQQTGIPKRGGGDAEELIDFDEL